ncbi:MAG: glycosyltransferase family 87 protein [Xanthobacteraceae bacterium]
MGGFIDSLRNGPWLTRERARLWALAALIASLAGILYIVATASGLSDYRGRPIGTDFSNVYAAGTYVLEGRPELAFNAPAQHAREKVIFGDATPFYGWHYPPFFLFIAALLALLPYLPALALWQGATLALYLISIHAIVSPSPRRAGRGEESAARAADHLWLLLAIAYPAVFVNLGHGQNGFLTAALIGFALALLDRRPIAAGILFGLLAYKPQFGLLIPLALMATGRWKTFAAAAVIVGALVVAATLVFGSDIWSAFFASAHFTREVVLEAGNTGWHKIQSVFSWVRMWGGPLPLAYAIQAIVTLVLAAATVWLWRSTAAFPVKAAGLILASILATPYSLDYDLMALAPAIAFLAAAGLARGFLPWEKTLLAALWLMPLIARSFTEVTSLPLAVPLMLVAFVLLLRRARTETASQSRDLSVAAF